VSLKILAKLYKNPSARVNLPEQANKKLPSVDKDSNGFCVGRLPEQWLLYFRPVLKFS